MSEITIFVIGSLIFAITVYGSVMAGGLALTRAEVRSSGLDQVDAEPVGPATVTPSSAPTPSASVSEMETGQF